MDQGIILNHKEAIGFAASFILTILIFIPYIYSILKQRVKPHIFSWIAWGLGNSIVFAAQWAKGGGIGSILIGVSGILCLIIAVLSIKHGEKNITRFDWFIFICSLLTIPLWWLAKDPLIAVIILTVIDFLAAMPTIRKSYNKPYEESIWIFFVSGARFLFSIPALDTINLTTAMFPAVIGVTDIFVMSLIMWRRHVITNQDKNHAIER